MFTKRSEGKYLRILYIQRPEIGGKLVLANFFEREYRNQKVLVIGAGISGFAAAKIAKRMGAEVTLSDAKQEQDIKYDFSELRAAGIRLMFGPQAAELLDGVQLILVSPA
ncbi:MAG: FAD-dependent oxidoreductase, partial [Selenomonadaceae bacterium]|nr:FAD-dependent oxidoreductase [Selenomonadaceae bacterium]